MTTKPVNMYCPKCGKKGMLARGFRYPKGYPGPVSCPIEWKCKYCKTVFSLHWEGR